MDCHASFHSARNDGIGKPYKDRKKFVITSDSEVIHIQKFVNFLNNKAVSTPCVNNSKKSTQWAEATLLSKFFTSINSDNLSRKKKIPLCYNKKIYLKETKMKSLKKFFLTIAMTMIVGTSAFAASGFEFLLNLYGGLGISVPNAETKDETLEGSLSADVGVDAQIGGMIQVIDRFGISILGDLGYAFDIHSYSGAGDKNYGLETINIRTHSFKVGLLPKFNIGFGGRHGLAIGIGGGVKIPISTSLEPSLYYTDGNNEKKYAKLGVSVGDGVKPDNFPIIGYVKATFDYYLFFTDNIAMTFGLYLAYDIGPITEASLDFVRNANDYTTSGIFDGSGNFGLPSKKYGGGAFDIGLQIGFRFGPKA